MAEVRGHDVTVNEVMQQWDKMDYVLDPIVDTLPPKHRTHYKNYVKFFIGKDAALANTSSPKMEWSFIKECKNVLLIGNYIKLGGQMLEYIDRRTAEYLNRKKETLARNAVFLKYFSGSMYQQMVTQRLINDKTGEHRGFFGLGKKKPVDENRIVETQGR